MSLEGDKISLSRKIIAGGLVFFAFLLLAIWFWRFNYIMNPTYDIGENEQKENNNERCVNGDCGMADSEDENKDTDGDGLSDWEEKNKFDTSPYLEDTDGDGITDKKEIEQGTNPNCPEGQECDGLSINSMPEQKDVLNLDKSDQEETVNQTPVSTSSTSSDRHFINTQDISVDSVDQESLKEVMKGDASADKIRRVLEEAGMSREVIDQISDEKLMQSYEESLNKLDQ
jgi:hypothetical protein